MTRIRTRNDGKLRKPFGFVPGAVTLSGAALLVIIVVAVTRGSAAPDPGAATAAREAAVASLTSKAGEVGALEVGWNAAQDRYVVRMPAR